MSEKIEAFYLKNNIPPALLIQKLDKFIRNEDIAKEFVYWIEHRSYVDNGIVVNGYTAKSISELSEYMDGEGAFLMLIELRENPEKASKRIQEGFKNK